jgi:hypothetical protein
MYCAAGAVKGRWGYQLVSRAPAGCLVCPASFLISAVGLLPTDLQTSYVWYSLVFLSARCCVSFLQSVLGLAAFWVFLGGLVGIVGFNYVNSKQFQDLKDRP